MTKGRMHIATFHSQCDAVDYSMRRYPDSMSLAEARALFFRHGNLGDDGGYSSRWVRVEAKPFPVYFC